MADRIYRPLKVIAFNANGIWMQRYELSKQLQGLHIDVVLFQKTQFKPHERFFIPNYHLYWTGHFPGIKGGTVVAVRKGIPYNHVNLPTLQALNYRI
jgi:exonuclease III